MLHPRSSQEVRGVWAGTEGWAGYGEGTGVLHGEACARVSSSASPSLPSSDCFANTHASSVLQLPPWKCFVARDPHPVTPVRGLH